MEKMNSFELHQARCYSESALINILSDLGAEIHYTIGTKRDGQVGPIGFQAFWLEER